MASAEGDSLKATVLHGSPFSYYECSKGDVRFRLASAPQVLSDPKSSSGDGRVAAFTVDGHSYAIFAPTGATWDWAKPTELVLHLPATARYFSVAGLPDNREATIRDFLAVAYAFPTDTRVEWAYDQKASAVRTTFRVDTVAKEGQRQGDIDGPVPAPVVERGAEACVAVPVRVGARPDTARPGKQLRAQPRLSRRRADVGRPAGRRGQGRASTACWSATMRNPTSCSRRRIAARTGSARRSAPLRN